MIIAQQKRKENIAEYVLYMWQVEDLLRACQLDDDRIDSLLVARFAAMPDVTPDRLADIRQWYHELRDMMVGEGLRQSGHLQIVRNVVGEMGTVHRDLLDNAGDAVYTAAYYAALPVIVDLRARTPDPLGEVETCLGGLYGLMVMRLEHREVSDATRAAMQQVAKLMALLADRYAHYKAHEEGLDDDAG